MSVKVMNLKELNAAYKKFIQLSTRDIQTNIELVGYRLFQGLQNATPRDTGRAINGWIPVVGGSPSEWSPPKGQGGYKALEFPFGQIKYDSIVWISNNVEYIVALDEGHSSQAPSGFTNPVFQGVQLYMEREVNKLNRKRYNV